MPDQQVWRKSSYSGDSDNCVEIALAAWRKSSYSGVNNNCVEVSLAAWRKSSYSGERENCVEVADLPDVTAVRDSKSPDAAVLAFPAAEWRTFVASLRRGEFES